MHFSIKIFSAKSLKYYHAAHAKVFLSKFGSIFVKDSCGFQNFFKTVEGERTWYSKLDVKSIDGEQQEKSNSAFLFKGYWEND